jgi:hypothetical protein
VISLVHDECKNITVDDLVAQEPYRDFSVDGLRPVEMIFG